jgi:hypothetical protein
MAVLAAQEARRLVWACAGEMTGGGTGVLEQVERAAQESSALIGRSVVAGVVNLAGEDAPARGECGEGHSTRLVQLRPKTIHTLLGGVQVTRGYYHCGACGVGFAPLDARLGVVGTSLSPGLVQACAVAGKEMPYATTTAFIEQVTGLRLASASTVNRVTISEGTRARNLIGQELAAARPGPVPAAWINHRPDKCYIVVDGTGAPMPPSETRGRAGKTSDQAGTREVKIGCFFTSSGVDAVTGDPVQDKDSVSYVSTFDPVDSFSHQVKAEYYRRGFDQIRQPIVLGDGAKWIWRIADERFPAATQIVDYYHAREHLAALVKLVTGLPDDPDTWNATLVAALDQGDTDTIADTVERLHLPDSAPHLVHDADLEVGYFTGNHHRMQYAHFKATGYFVGSGFVESACNTIVKQRAKRAGMHWKIRGLDPVITLRTLDQSGRLDLIWKPPHSRHTQK